MRRPETRPVPLSNDALAEAAALLKAGELVAVPTETVYGLAADATNEDAVARIYEVKGRPPANPLIAHVASEQMAAHHANFTSLAVEMTDAHWPGPLTLVLEGGAGLAEAVTAGLPTVALRQPKGPMATLSAMLDCPLAAPSANRSGALSPTRAEHVAEGLGDRIAMILDAGSCEAGLESTIVKIAANKATLLRPGPLSLADLAQFNVKPATGDGAVESPGTHFRHYAPSIPVRLNVTSVEDGEALIAFGAPISANTSTFQLSRAEDLAEAAHNLFNALWQAERSGARAIAVQSVPETGIGAAINERLHRAAEGGGEAK